MRKSTILSLEFTALVLQNQKKHSSLFLPENQRRRKKFYIIDLVFSAASAFQALIRVGSGKKSVKIEIAFTS